MTMARGTVIQIRVSDEEKLLIAANASEADVPVGEYLRRLGSRRGLWDVLTAPGRVTTVSVPATRAAVQEAEREAAMFPEPRPNLSKTAGGGTPPMRTLPSPDQHYRCPLDCKPSWRPTSPTAPCPVCNRRNLVPA